MASSIRLVYARDKETSTAKFYSDYHLICPDHGKCIFSFVKTQEQLPVEKHQFSGTKESVLDYVNGNDSGLDGQNDSQESIICY